MTPLSARRSIRGGQPQPLRHLRAVLARFPLDSYASATTLIAQETIPQNVFVLQSGLVKLSHRLADGRSTVVGLRGCNGVLGAESALARRASPVTVTAVTACHCHRIAAAGFAALMRGRGAIVAWIHAAQFAEFGRQVAQAASMARLSARERLTNYLEFAQSEMEHDAKASSDQVDLPLRDWELAQLLAITPSYMSRLLHELRAQGRLTRRGRRTRLVPIAGAKPS